MRNHVVIIGAGPGGASAALMLAREGVRATMVESSRFPRFHIGESLTGGVGEVFRTLGLSEQMQRCDHTLKHGVRVYGPSGKNEFWVPVMARSEDGGYVKTHTWQVRRSDFDKLLLDAALEAGAELVHGKVVDVVRDERGDVAGVTVRGDDGEHSELAADVVIDASGQSTVLSNLGVASAKVRGNYDRQIAIYSHFRGVKRDPDKEGEATFIFVGKKNHWAWLIPIGDEVTSVGLVVPASYFKECGEDTRSFYLREVHSLNPQLSRRIEGVELVEDVRTNSNYSYRVDRYTGRNFLCIGDSHRFVDPIFSFGLHFAVLEARHAVDHITRYFADPALRDRPDPFAEFAALCDRAQNRVESMIDCFWTNSLAFSFYVHHKYRNDMIDAFAGRLYGDETSPGLQAIAKTVQIAS
ncbi:MAG: tryptophan 7-halogenase [Myxococcales bacterium]|nr:tryptophan 7-halogenase [Myxococcales bacterium]MCB9754966.1 tryptophan 7-halogenase [Myxococcales bacterium]